MGEAGLFDYSRLAPQFVEMEIKAHPDLAGLPISELQIDNRGNIIWLANGACDVRYSKIRRSVLLVRRTATVGGGLNRLTGLSLI
jgi:hypothetical protein